jgi:VanZ family protein
MKELSKPPIARIGLAALLVRVLSIAVILGMFFGTHLPYVGPQGINHMDKVLHFSAYLLLTTCLLTSWELTRLYYRLARFQHKLGVLQPSHYFVVWLVVILYGLFDEITQIPFGRTCDGLDWLADVAGAATGLVLFQAVRFLMFRFLGVGPTLSGPTLSGPPPNSASASP